MFEPPTATPPVARLSARRVVNLAPVSAQHSGPLPGSMALSLLETLISQSFLWHTDVPPKSRTADCRFREKSRNRVCAFRALMIHR